MPPSTLFYYRAVAFQPFPLSYHSLVPMCVLEVDKRYENIILGHHKFQSQWFHNKLQNLCEGRNSWKFYTVPRYTLVQCVEHLVQLEQETLHSKVHYRWIHTSPVKGTAARILPWSPNTKRCRQSPLPGQTFESATLTSSGYYGLCI